MKKQMSMILAGLLLGQATLALGACAKDRSQDSPELGVVISYTTSPARPTRAEEAASVIGTEPTSPSSSGPSETSMASTETQAIVLASNLDQASDQDPDQSPTHTIDILPMNDEKETTPMLAEEETLATTAAEIDANQSYREGVFVLPEALDPWHNEDQESIQFLYALFQPLLGVRDNGKGGQSLYYAAADQVTCSPDRRTYTFHLREEGKWSDGEPVKAGEFVEGLAKIFDPATPSPFYSFFEKIENASEVATGSLPLSELGVSAPDDGHLVIRLAAPQADFLQACALPCAIPYRLQMKALRTKEALFAGDTGVSNGPYMIESWGDKQVILLKNPYFHAQGRVHLSPITLRKYDSGQAAIEDLYAGQLDRVTILRSLGAQELGPSPAQVKKQEVLMPLTHFLFFQCQKPPFNQVKIRQALGLTVDRQLATQLLGEEAFVPATGWIPPNVQVGKESYRTNTPDYFSVFQNEITNPQALLVDGMKEAGLGENPENLTLELATGARGEGEKELIEALAKDWEEKLGIHVHPVVYPWPAFLEKIKAGDLDVAYEAWRSEMPIPDPLMRLAGSEQSAHLGSLWKNEAYDDLLIKADAEVDPGARLALYQEAESILIREMSVIPLAYAKKITYVAESLKAMDLSSLSSMSYVGAYFSGRDLVDTDEPTSSPSEQEENETTGTSEATEVVDANN